MKRTLAILLAVFMVFGLVACGGGETAKTEEPAPAEEQPAEEAPAEEPADEEPAEEPAEEEEEPAEEEEEPAEEEPEEEPEEEEPAEEPEEEPEEEPAEEEDLLTMTQEEVIAQAEAEGINDYPVEGQVIIGDSTDTSGEFLDGWSNAMPDSALKTMIHGGLNTMYYDPDGVFHLNPMVVKDYEAIENEDGSKTIKIQIYDNLTFTDGSPVDVDDYLISILMHNSWEFGSELIGGYNVNHDVLVGFEEFNQNEDCKTFAGVHRYDDYTFGITIKAEELPFHWDFTLANVGPYPMDVIAPGVTITDDGSGATLSDEWTPELLQKTLLDPETGYRYAPTVSAGPYRFISHDKTTRNNTIQASEHFIGMYNGKKPSIKTIIFKKVTDKTMFEDLKTGGVDLLAPVNGKDVIESGLEVVEENPDDFDFITFDRLGFGYVGFHCDMSPTQYKPFRQALAHLLDRQEFLKQYAGAYATIVHGSYGLAMPEYQYNADELEEQLNPYPFNPDKAVELLEEAGFIYNEQGEPYDGEGLRCKKIEDESELPPKVEGVDTNELYDQIIFEVDGEKYMRAIVNWANTPDNPVSELIRTLLLPEAEKVGVQITDNTMDFMVMYPEHFMRNANQKPKNEIKFTMFNLATGFGLTPYYWYDVNPAEEFLGTNNQYYINDPKLLEIAMEMKKIPFEDEEDWMDKWLEYQIAYNDYLPCIPLYSDIYHVFKSSKIVDYYETPYFGYGEALPFARIEE